MNKTVTTRIQAGLGNQLFQYAAGRAVAERHGSELQVLRTVDDSVLEFRPFELDNYAIRGEIVDWKTLRRCHVDRPSRRDDLLIRLRGRTPFRQQVGHYDPRIHQAPANAFLMGWWMSEQHFLDAADTIREEFMPLALSDAARRWQGLIEGAQTSVAIHVRRGDMATRPDAVAFHGSQPPEYYARAAAEVMRRLPDADPHWFVCSDDPQWCAEHLDPPGKMSIVSGSELSMHDDLYLMSLCDHQITANSSFSWWAAWLGEKRGNSADGRPRVVVAPERWFASEPTNALEGMIPQRWIEV